MEYRTNHHYEYAYGDAKPGYDTPDQDAVDTPSLKGLKNVFPWGHVLEDNEWDLDGDCWFDIVANRRLTAAEAKAIGLPDTLADVAERLEIERNGL